MTSFIVQIATVVALTMHFVDDSNSYSYYIYLTSIFIYTITYFSFLAFFLSQFNSAHLKIQDFFLQMISSK